MDLNKKFLEKKLSLIIYVLRAKSLLDKFYRINS